MNYYLEVQPIRLKLFKQSYKIICGKKMYNLFSNRIENKMLNVYPEYSYTPLNSIKL